MNTHPFKQVDVFAGQPLSGNGCVAAFVRELATLSSTA